MMMRIFSVIGCSLLCAQTAVQAQEGSVNRGHVMWSAFECAWYAEMAGERKEQERLFKVGYKIGSKFLAEVIKNTVPKEEIKNAPLIVRWLISGPNVDFIIGRIFQSAVEEAYDSVVKKDNAGIPISDQSMWIMDEVLKITIAKTKFLQANCAILQ